MKAGAFTPAILCCGLSANNSVGRSMKAGAFTPAILFNQIRKYRVAPAQ